MNRFCPHNGSHFVNVVHEILPRSTSIPERFLRVLILEAWEAKHNILEHVRPREDHSVYNAPLRTKQGFCADLVAVVVVDLEFREQRTDSKSRFPPSQS